MISVYKEENCCGLLVIGNFPYDREISKTENIIKQEIEEEILEYEREDFRTEYEPFHGMLIATTNENQQKTAKVLKLLGFRGSKFDSKHVSPGNKELTFWKRNKLPKDIASRLRKENKEYVKRIWG